MNPKLGAVGLFLLITFLAGCVLAPSGWSSKEAVERLAREKVPVGSSKQIAEGFFLEAGVKWTEYPNPATPMLQREKLLGGWADIKVSAFGLVTTSVGVRFYLGADEKVERIEVSQSLTGL